MKRVRSDEPSRTLRYAERPDGRYEVIDERSQSRSAPIDLEPGGQTEVTLEVP